MDNIERNPCVDCEEQHAGTAAMGIMVAAIYGATVGFILGIIVTLKILVPLGW